MGAAARILVTLTGIVIRKIGLVMTVMVAVMKINMMMMVVMVADGGDKNSDGEN